MLLINNNFALGSFDGRGLSGFGLLPAHSIQKGKSNEQNERQGAHI